MRTETGSEEYVAASHMHRRRKSFAVCPGWLLTATSYLKDEQVPSMDGKVAVCGPKFFLSRQHPWAYRPWGPQGDRRCPVTGQPG